jgi:hypothetical protein
LFEQLFMKMNPEVIEMAILDDVLQGISKGKRSDSISVDGMLQRISKGKRDSENSESHAHVSGGAGTKKSPAANNASDGGGGVPWKRWAVHFLPVLVSALVAWFIVEQVQAELDEVKIQLALYDERHLQLTNSQQALQDSLGRESTTLAVLQIESVRLDARLQLVQEELADVTDLTGEIQELSSDLSIHQQTLDDNELSLLFLEQSSTVQSGELTRIGRGLDSQVDLLGEVSEKLEVVNQENDVALTTIAEAIRVADESAALIGTLAEQFDEETSKFYKPSDFVKGSGSSIQISSNCLVSLDCDLCLGDYKFYTTECDPPPPPSLQPPSHRTIVTTTALDATNTTNITAPPPRPSSNLPSTITQAPMVMAITIVVATS